MAEWKLVDSKLFRPDYLDVPGNSLRAYGASIQVDETNQSFSIKPDSRGLPFIKYFAAFFLPTSVAIALAFIRSPEKWMFAIGGPVFGGIVFSIIYSLISNEVGSGSYISIDFESDSVRLPRYSVEFDRENVECLQWITGGSKSRISDRSTDLNLIVRAADGSKHRYFILGGPQKNCQPTCR